MRRLQLVSAFIVVISCLAYYIIKSSSTRMAALRLVKESNLKLDLQKKHAIVVGGTSGIGRGIAERLARAKCSITIVGRESGRSKIVLDELNKIVSENNAEQQKVNFVKCDCFLLKNVNKCVDSILEDTKEKGIDYLVMSQGMATIQGFTPSKEEGLDQKLTLHVWSRATFATRLLQSLKMSKDPRIITVLSAGVHSSYKHYETDFELSRGNYSIKNAADAAGFYNDVLVEKLAEENKELTVMHACPGFVATNWGTEMPSVLRWMVRGIQAIGGRSRQDCAEYMIRGLTNEKLKGGFHLLNEYGEATQKVSALHDEAKDFIWKSLNELINAAKSIASSN